MHWLSSCCFAASLLLLLLLLGVVMIVVQGMLLWLLVLMLLLRVLLWRQKLLLLLYLHLLMAAPSSLAVACRVEAICSCSQAPLAASDLLFLKREGDSAKAPPFPGSSSFHHQLNLVHQNMCIAQHI